MNDIAFYNPEGDNNYRPYKNGVLEHEENIASIILVADGNNYTVDDSGDEINGFKVDNSSPKVDELDVDYPLTDLNGSENIMIPKLSKLSEDYYGIFNNFSLLNVSESRSQISKVNLNLGDSWNVFFFGKNPLIYSFSGIFLDARNYPYYEEFTKAYDLYMSGGKSLENNFKTYMTYDGKIVSGYILSLTTTSRSETPHVKSFKFNMLISEENFARRNFSYKNESSAINYGLDNTNRLGNFARDESYQVLEEVPSLGLA